MFHAVLVYGNNIMNVKMHELLYFSHNIQLVIYHSFKTIGLTKAPNGVIKLDNLKMRPV